MGSWNERRDQELRRIAAEEAARIRTESKRKNQLAQAAEVTKRENDAISKEKLKLFDELRIPQTMEQIKRDIWRGGKGKVEVDADNQSWPHRISLLTLYATTVLPKTETVRWEEFGPYTSHSSGPSGFERTYHHNGKHTVSDQKLIGATELEVEEALRAEMYYTPDSRTYQLQFGMSYYPSKINYEEVGGYKGKMAKDLDSMFLKFVTDMPRISDIEDMMRRRRDYIRSNTGRVAGTAGSILGSMASHGLFDSHELQPENSIKDIFLGSKRK